MIANRGLRMEFYFNARCTFIVLFAFVIAPISVFGEYVKNSTNNCGGDFSGYQYTISSPNYPENYPRNQDCVYTLRGSKFAKCDQVFHLQFLDFALKPSENCDEDYLKIGQRSLYCGSVAGIRSYPSGNNSLTLRFHSAAGNGGKGFKILVTTSPCNISQDDKKNNANSAESTATVMQNEATTKATDSNNSKLTIGSRNDLDSASFLEPEYPYPIYRPEINFTVEDESQFGSDDQSKIETLDKSGKNILQRVQQNIPQHLADNLQLPVHRSKEFRESSQPKLQIVTAAPTESQYTPKISWHLFVPANEKESTENGAFVRFSSGNVSKDLKADINNFVTPPSNDLLLPNRWATSFRKTAVKDFTENSPLIDRERPNEKFIVPARSYGVPDGPYYHSSKEIEPEIGTGEVLENSGGSADCQGKNNLEPDLEVTANFRGKNPALIDFVGTGNPATTYGAPGLNFPSNVQNTRFIQVPSFNYAPQPNYFPGATGNGRPSGWIPSTGFPNNIGNNYPNSFPPPGIVPGNIYPTYPGIGGRYPDCCNNIYSAQRFLLASPEFPSLSYSGNSYECVYSIRPYSPNVCRMRFNFKFFNHGTEDRFCSNGYVDIDGRRVCGCKKNFSIVSTVYPSFPKVIGVKYSGHPRTKFNGFLIEVIQESCSIGYPFGSRRKKDTWDATNGTIARNYDETSEIARSSSHRTKRNLGYSYPKPNFGLVEVPGASQSWNSGGNFETGVNHPLNGHAANLFSPLLTCQALSFFDWTVAAKDVFLRGGRCIRNGGTGVIPGNPGNWIPGNPSPIYPGYPSNPWNGGTGVWNPSNPWIGGSVIINPVRPGPGGWNLPLTKCEDINVIEGIITSPQYPANYPNNANKCFRFHKTPNTCQLELAILDFDLENSPGCAKDYLAISGQNQRYCGRSLAGGKTFVDIAKCNVVDIHFVSDGTGSGRGFSAGFSQIPCRDSPNH